MIKRFVHKVMRGFGFVPAEEYYNLKNRFHLFRNFVFQNACFGYEASAPYNEAKARELWSKFHKVSDLTKPIPSDTLEV